MKEGILGCWCVTIGTVLVAVGGLLATFGWDKVRSHKERKNAIVGVMREVELNGRMIVTATALADRWTTRSEGENFAYPKAWPAIQQDALAEPFRNLLRAHETAKVLLERQYPWAKSNKTQAAT